MTTVRTTKKKEAVAKPSTPAKGAPQKRRKTLTVASTAEAFWTVDGQVLYTLGDLATALASLERRVYQYHADPAYQDFAVWVATVLGDKKCATALKKAPTQKAAYLVVREHLAMYNEA